MIITKGKTNWMYVAVVALSAALTGAFLISYINSNADGGIVVAGGFDTNQ